MHSPVELQKKPAAQAVQAEVPEARERENVVRARDCENKGLISASFK